MTVGQPSPAPTDFKQVALQALQMLQTTVDTLLTDATSSVNTVAPEIVQAAETFAEELVPAPAKQLVIMILTSVATPGTHVLEGLAVSGLSFAKARIDSTLEALEKQFQQ